MDIKDIIIGKNYLSIFDKEDIIFTVIRVEYDAEVVIGKLIDGKYRSGRMEDLFFPHFMSEIRDPNEILKTLL